MEQTPIQHALTISRRRSEKLKQQLRKQLQNQSKLETTKQNTRIVLSELKKTIEHKTQYERQKNLQEKQVKLKQLYDLMESYNKINKTNISQRQELVNTIQQKIKNYNNQTKQSNKSFPNIIIQSHDLYNKISKSFPTIDDNVKKLLVQWIPGHNIFNKNGKLNILKLKQSLQNENKIKILNQLFPSLTRQQEQHLKQVIHTGVLDKSWEQILQLMDICYRYRRHLQYRRPTQINKLNFLDKVQITNDNGIKIKDQENILIIGFNKILLNGNPISKLENSLVKNIFNKFVIGLHTKSSIGTTDILSSPFVFRDSTNIQILRPEQFGKLKSVMKSLKDIKHPYQQQVKRKFQNLQLWLDASNMSGSELHENNVIMWKDKSGKQHNATAWCHPVKYVLNGVNGRPSLYFGDGTGFVSKIPAGTLEQCTIFIVYHNVTSGGAPLLSRRTSGYSPFDMYENSRLAYGTSVQSSFNLNIITQNPTIFICKFGRGTSWQEWANGVQSQLPELTGHYVDDANNIYIGARDDRWCGTMANISEILIYNKILSLDEQHKIENILKHKWGFDY